MRVYVCACMPDVRVFEFPVPVCAYVQLHTCMHNNAVRPCLLPQFCRSNRYTYKYTGTNVIHMCVCQLHTHAQMHIYPFALHCIAPPHCKYIYIYALNEYYTHAYILTYEYTHITYIPVQYALWRERRSQQLHTHMQYR